MPKTTNEISNLVITRHISADSLATPGEHRRQRVHANLELRHRNNECHHLADVLVCFAELLSEVAHCEKRFLPPDYLSVSTQSASRRQISQQAGWRKLGA